MTVVALRGALVAGASSAPTAPLLVLLPSLGTTASRIWTDVATELVASPIGAGLRIITIDLPGHGWSPPATGPVTMAELASAVLEVVDELGADRFHIAGVSLGGAIGLELAVAAPDRVASLALFCTGARIGSLDGWAQRAADVRASGTASLVTGSADRWFAPGFLAKGRDVGARALAELVDVDDFSYAAAAEALGAWDRRGQAAILPQRVLLVSGSHDSVTSSVDMQQLAESLQDARHVVVADAAHLVPLEQPKATADLLIAHLESGIDGSRLSTRATGLAVRRAVLGDAHVDRATASTTPETADFQDFITRYAWGEIWARPALPTRERSMITIASLVTGGHHDELVMHLRAAFRNGVRADEISEVIQHTALYAGLPAANTALTLLRDVIAERSGSADTGTRPPGDTNG